MEQKSVSSEELDPLLFHYFLRYVRIGPLGCRPLTLKAATTNIRTDFNV